MNYTHINTDHPYGKKDLWSKLLVENKCLILRIFWDFKMFLKTAIVLKSKVQ